MAMDQAAQRRSSENPRQAPRLLEAPGGVLLVEALLAQGADTAFCVPGESYLPVLDALYDVRDRIRLITCRQEGGAAFMAEAHGKLTGRPGICFVTRGPGASNAAIGVHTAKQDSTPMILFIGQVGRAHRDREAFQEVDYAAMFGGLAKWAAEIPEAARIPEYVSRAFRVATTGRPGPVVLALPEEVLSSRAAAEILPPVPCPGPAPAAGAMRDLELRLALASRPLMIVGGSGWTPAAIDHLARFAERQDIPVAASFRRQSLFDNDSPHYAGDLGLGPNPKLAERVRNADLLIVVGARMSENMTGSYELLPAPRLPQPLVHVHPGIEELGKVYAPDLAIHADLEEFCRAAAALAPRGPERAVWRHSARADYESWTSPGEVHGAVHMGVVMRALRDLLPDDAILTNGAGNYATWAHRYFRYKPAGPQLAPTSGAMGYGVPAAIAAKAAHPDRPVVALAGDGCFMMTGQELATAVQYRLPVVIIVVNNGMYGTIRMHQERNYPARVIGTDLANPDFPALARAYGAAGYRVDVTDRFAPVFAEARARAEETRLPALIEIALDPQDITPRETLDEIRARASARSRD